MGWGSDLLLDSGYLLLYSWSKCLRVVFATSVAFTWMILTHELLHLSWRKELLEYLIVWGTSCLDPQPKLLGLGSRVLKFILNLSHALIEGFLSIFKLIICLLKNLEILILDRYLACEFMIGSSQLRELLNHPTFSRWRRSCCRCFHTVIYITSNTFKISLWFLLIYWLLISMKFSLYITYQKRYRFRWLE